MVPDVTGVQEIGASRIGHPGLEIGNELGFGNRHRSPELQRHEECAKHEKRDHPGREIRPANPHRQIMSEQNDHGDGRHIHQKMDVVDQDQDDRKERRQQYKADRLGRDQQKDDRKQAAVDIEMPQRVHEVLEEERRARGEDKQRHMGIVKAERAPE